MLDALITSKTRVKLLLKFFLNSNTEAYLRHLETEFGESSNAIRLELNRLEKAGLLISFNSGNKKLFKANTEYPLFNEINQILKKYVGLDLLIDKVLTHLGNECKVYLVGRFAKGIDDKHIDLVFVGDNLNESFLISLLNKSEQLLNRKVRYEIITNQEFTEGKIKYTPHLLLW